MQTKDWLHVAFVRPTAKFVKENADFELPIHVAVKLVPELSPGSQTEGCARF